MFFMDVFSSANLRDVFLPLFRKYRMVEFVGQPPDASRTSKSSTPDRKTMSRADD